MFMVGDVMLNIDFRGVRLCVKFSFFFVIALLALTEGFEEVRLFAALGACVCHELGHIFAMSAFGSAPEEIALYGGGIKITTQGEQFFGRGVQTVILLAGCAVNFVLAAVFFITGAPRVLWLVNVVLGCFNLLPFSYFDGGRVLELYLPIRAYDHIRAAAVALTAIGMIWLILSGKAGPSLGATYALVLISELTKKR